MYSILCRLLLLKQLNDALRKKISLKILFPFFSWGFFIIIDNRDAKYRVLMKRLLCNVNRRFMLNSVKVRPLSAFCFLFEQNNQGKPADVDQSTVVVNSIIEAGIDIGKESVVSHCHLQVPSWTGFSKLYM